jgi:uncharacterized protein YneF (UPF0154 family)
MNDMMIIIVMVFSFIVGLIVGAVLRSQHKIPDYRGHDE